MMAAEPETKSVVHVIYSGLGGHAAVMFSLLEAGFLKSSRHHVVLAGVEPPLKEYTDRLDRMGLSWSYVGKPPGRGHFGFFRRLRAEFKKHRPDLLFLNGLAALPATLTYRLVPRQARPTIVLRESEPVQLKGCYQWVLLALAHFGADKIVHLTPEAANSAQAKLKFLHRTDKVTIIPNGLDTEFFKPVARPRDGDTIRIGMVSRLQHTKDHITLLAAFDKLRTARPKRRYKLYIAGDGATRPQIESEIKLRKLQDAVVMCGTLDRIGVRDLLAKLDLYVHATFGETMSNSIMQAMSMELPIIASDVDGLSLIHI